MLEFLRQLVTGVFEAWKRLSISARVQIGLAAALTVVILGGVVLFGGQPQYVELFTRLGASEADTVIGWLTERDIAYQVRDGGRTIRVPAQHQSAARIGLVSQGIPRNQGTIPGFELFDTQTLMTNKWLQDTNYMRAVKGELTRTLNEFDFIRNSVVFISEAKDQLFRSEQKPSQATVTLDLFRPVTDEEIAAVLLTVSAFGGHNLNERNITITNTQGQVLKRPDSDDTISLASNRRELRETWESHYEKKVSGALAELGYNAIVTASVQVDWDTVETHEREVKPGETISSLDGSTTVTTTESPPEGAAGATANIADGAVVQGGTRTTEEVTETIENSDPSEVVTTTLTPAGTLKKLSLGVVVDDVSVVTTDDQGETTTTRQAPTQQDLAILETLVLSAVTGAALVTEVSLAHLSFPQAGVALAGVTALPAAAPWFQNRIILTVMQGFLILAAFFAIRFFMRRALVLPSEEIEEAVEIPEATKEDMRRMEIASEVERLSREEPESVAALLRSWMAEEE